MCLTSCLGIRCNNDEDCASGKHCSGTYHKVCSRTHTAQACYTNGDCSTGQCCDDDRKCASGACDSKKESKSESNNITIWLLVVGLVIPFTVVIVSLCIICCSRKRKASEKSRETISERHENIQIPTKRTT